MEKYIENEQANFQINAIKSMLVRGLCDIEIAAKLNGIGEVNLNNPQGGWSAKDVRSIITDFNLVKFTSDGSEQGKNGWVLRYKLVNNLGFGDVFLQIVLWLILCFITFGLAIPFFTYYFTKLLINTTEIHEKY